MGRRRASAVLEGRTAAPNGCAMEVTATTTPLGPPTMALEGRTTARRTRATVLKPGATGPNSASMSVEVGADGVGGPAKPVGGRAMGGVGVARNLGRGHHNSFGPQRGVGRAMVGKA